METPPWAEERPGKLSGWLESHSSLEWLQWLQIQYKEALPTLSQRDKDPPCCFSVSTEHVTSSFLFLPFLCLPSLWAVAQLRVVWGTCLTFIA